MTPVLLRYFFIVDTPIDNLLDYKTCFINPKGKEGMTCSLKQIREKY